MFIKLLLNFIIFFTIYSHAFTSLGNTTYRINSQGIEVYSLIPMFTEGFYGPIRTLILFLSNNYYLEFVKFIWVMMSNFWSPYSVILFVYLINKNF